MCCCCVQDILADKVKSETESDKLSAASLVVFVVPLGEIEEAVVTANTARVITCASDMYEAMLLLIALYYVANLAFLKVYINMLSILQQFVMGEAYTGERSSNCIVFLKKYTDKM